MKHWFGFHILIYSLKEALSLCSFLHFLIGHIKNSIWFPSLKTKFCILIDLSPSLSPSFIPPLFLSVCLYCANTCAYIPHTEINTQCFLKLLISQMIYYMQQPVSTGPLEQLCLMCHIKQRKGDVIKEHLLVFLVIKWLHNEKCDKQLGLMLDDISTF